MSTMYMNLKPNKHKRISFNTTTMSSLGFKCPPKILGSPINLAPPKFNFLLRFPPQLFWSGIFRLPPKIRGWGGGGVAPWACQFFWKFASKLHLYRDLHVDGLYFCVIYFYPSFVKGGGRGSLLCKFSFIHIFNPKSCGGVNSLVGMI